jgi:predicted outer membrane repeat protein
MRRTSQSRILRARAAVIGALASALVPVHDGLALTLRVSPDGSSYYPTIQAAADAAAPGDTILLESGTYTGAGNREIDFLGKDLLLTSAAGAEATLIDCEYEGRGFYLHSSESRACVIQNVKITRGQASGVRLSGASPTLKGLIVQYGSPSGGISLTSSGAAIEDCLIQGNHSSSDGGGVLIGSGCDSVEIRRCTLSGNSASWGGGLYMLCSGSILIEDVYFGNNAASWTGGGAYIANSSSAVLSGTTFSGNSSGSKGGGLYAANASVQIDHCAFHSNSSVNGGGAFLTEAQSVVEIRSTSFIDNEASFGGGGLTTLNWAQTRLVDCSFVANSARPDKGGSIDAYWHTVNILENVIVSYSTQGLGLRGVDEAALTISCSDVFGNPGGNYGGQWSDQTGLNGNLSLDPLYCDLAGQDFTLADESPCLPVNNDCGVLIGAFDEGCTLTGAGAAESGESGLGAGFPNPFNPATTLPYRLSSAGPVRVSVYDLKGRLLRELVKSVQPAGSHAATWDGRDAAGRALPSGVYLVRLEAEGRSEEQKLTLLR